MCFSATASLTAAAVLGVTGIVSLSQTTQKRQILLAAFPLLFAAQQLIEGLIWLHLVGRIDYNILDPLNYSFLFFADVLWPFIAPLAVFLIEPQKRRRWLMMPFVIGGALAAAYLLYILNAATILSVIQNHHIRYSQPNVDVIPQMRMIYLAVTAGAFLLTSHRWVLVFGVCALISSFIADYYAGVCYASVWCFFAAALSIILCIHFWTQKRRSRQSA